MSKREQVMLSALRRIADYESPESLKENAESLYGLDPAEALEMAYENVIEEARQAVDFLEKEPQE